MGVKPGVGVDGWAVGLGEATSTAASALAMRRSRAFTAITLMSTGPSAVGIHGCLMIAEYIVSAVALSTRTSSPFTYNSNRDQPRLATTWEMICVSRCTGRKVPEEGMTIITKLSGSAEQAPSRKAQIIVRSRRVGRLFLVFTMCYSKKLPKQIRRNTQVSL